MISGGKVSDNNEIILTTLFKEFSGTVFGDKGYLMRFKNWLAEQGVKLITKVRKNMKPLKLSKREKHYLKRRAFIETVFGLLTFSCDLDHTRHRSQKGMAGNVLTALIAYSYFDHFPQIKRFSQKEVQEKGIVLFIETGK